jgi:hypothetical protein
MENITSANLKIFIAEDNTVLGETLSVTYNNLRNRDSKTGIPRGYERDSRGSIPGWGKRLLSTPQRPHRLWGPPRLLSDGYRRFFPRE